MEVLLFNLSRILHKVLQVVVNREELSGERVGPAC
jgi:hypothetical protein